MSRRALTTVVVGLVVVAGALALAAPAGAVPPTGKRYTVDFFGAHINSPFDLVFMGTDCVTFSQGNVACFPNVANDCGRVTITGVYGSVTHFEIELRFKIGSPGFWLVEGPVTVAGTVDRAGAGSTISMSGSGALRSNLFLIPRTRTNISLHGVEGCSTMSTLKPEESWVRDH